MVKVLKYFATIRTDKNEVLCRASADNKENLMGFIEVYLSNTTHKCKDVAIKKNKEGKIVKVGTVKKV